MAAGNLAEYELLRPQYGDLGNARDPHHRQPFEELEHDAFDPRPYPAPQKRRPHGLLQTLLLRPRSRTSLLAAALLAIGFSLFVILPPGDRAGRSLPEPGTVSGRIAGTAAPPAPDRVVALREGDASGSSADEESDPSPARPAPPPPPSADGVEAEGVAQDAVDQTDLEPADESVGVPATGSNEDGGAESPNVLAPDQPASEDTVDAPGDDTEVPGTQDDDDGDSEGSPEGTLLGTPSELQPTRTAGITADPAVTGVAASSTESEDEKAGRRNGEAGTPEEAERSGDAVEMAKEAEDEGDAVEKANEAEDDGDAVEMAKEAEDDDDAAGEPDGAQESGDAVEKTEGEKKGQDAVKKTESPERVDDAVEKTEGPEKGDVPLEKTEGLEEKNDSVEKTGDGPSESLTGTAAGDPAVQAGGGGSADASGEKGGTATENMIGGTHGPTEDADGVYADEGSVPAADSGATVGADPENPVSEFDTTTTAVGGTGGDHTQTVAGPDGISGGRTTPIRPSPTSAHPGETGTVETLGSAAPESAAAAETPGLSTPPPTPHPAVPVTPSATSDDGHGQASTESFADRGGEPADDPHDLSDSARPVAAAAEAAPVADGGDGATTPGALNRPPPEIRDEEPANDDAAAASASARDGATAVGGELSGAGRDADAGRAVDDDEEEEGETVHGLEYGRAAGEEDDGPAAGSVVNMTEFAGETRRVSEEGGYPGRQSSHE